MFSVEIFVIRQLYFVVTKPDRLILIPTFVKFRVISSDSNYSNSNFNLNSNSNNNNNNNNNHVTIDNLNSNTMSQKKNDFFVEINRHGTSLYRLLTKINQSDQCTCLCCQMNINININALKISKLFDSYCVWIFIFVFLILYFIIVSITDYEIAGWLHLSMLVIATCMLIIVNLNINYLIVTYSLRSFVFWWKLQNCIILMLLEIAIDYENKVGKFSLQNNSLSEAYAMSVCNVIAPTLSFAGISMVFGTFVNIRLKILFIFLAMVYWAHGIVRIFIVDDENDVNISIVEGYSVSCKSTILAKTFDIILWYFVQLVDQIRFNNGICVSGKVKRKWIGYDDYGNEYIYHHNDINNEFGFVLIAEQSSTLQTATVATRSIN